MVARLATVAVPPPVTSHSADRWVHTMVERVQRLIESLDEWALRRKWTRVARAAVIGFFEHDTLQYAGSMAYFAMLSVFQVIVLAIVVLSSLLGEGTVREFLLDRIEEGSPLDSEVIADMIDATLASRGTLTVVGVVVLVWSALGLFASISRGVSRVFDTEPPQLIMWDQFRGLLLMGLTGVLAVGAVAVGIVTGAVERFAAEALAELPGAAAALSLIGLVVPLVLIFGAFWVLYRVVPHRAVGALDALPGAILATVLWTVLRLGFSFYTTNIAPQDPIFGTVSSAITFLLFLYFASVVLLIGAEFARASADDRQPPEAG